MARYSKQREAIREILMGTTAHPTAAEVYMEAKKVIPNISLGTVYRNLETLTGSGDAQDIRVGEFTHFDGNAKPHPHFCCNMCGRVSDLKCDMDGLFSSVEGLEGNRITSTTVLFCGVCRECSVE